MRSVRTIAVDAALGLAMVLVAATGASAQTEASDAAAASPLRGCEAGGPGACAPTMVVTEADQRARREAFIADEIQFLNGLSANKRACPAVMSAIQARGRFDLLSRVKDFCQ